MTDIDPRADIELHPADGQVTVRVPLTGPVTSEWLGCYLYLGFTDATAFSPTDVMPLTRWAKLAMTAQSVCSLMILGLVIARAANILQ